MTTGIERGDELNELGWWSNWAKLAWFSRNSYFLSSRAFEEPLFNHAGFLVPKVKPDRFFSLIERTYQRAGITPAFFLQNLPKFRPIKNDLLDRGYTLADEFLVLQLVEPSSISISDFTRRIVLPRDLDDWCRTYLQSFYGELSLLKQVRASVSRALRQGKARLILAMAGGEPAGALALYRRQQYLGVYCVGTLPNFRELGVATAMLGWAQELAQAKRSSLVLQTFLSDSVEDFYYKRGFKLIYSKDVLLRK